MTSAQKLAILQTWANRIIESDALLEPAIEALGLPPESPICTAIWSLQGALTQAVQAQLEDATGWLDWHHHENQMGERQLEAGPKGKTRPIRNLEDLLWVMEAA